MTIDRDKLCVGLVGRQFFLSLKYERKIIFNYDEYEQQGFDLKNNVTYPVGKSNVHNGFYISNIIFLKPILESLGYPEKLEDVHIERIMEDDFKKVFIDSSIMKSLYSCELETFSPLFCKPPFSVLKNEFIIHDLENEFNHKKSNIQKVKRR